MPSPAATQRPVMIQNRKTWGLFAPDDPQAVDPTSSANKEL